MWDQDYLNYLNYLKTLIAVKGYLLLKLFEIINI